MPKGFRIRIAISILALMLSSLGGWMLLHTVSASPPPIDTLEERFAKQMQPFLKSYCYSCHGTQKQKASLDLSRDASVSALVKNFRQWEQVLEKLQSKEMPPEDALRQPKPEERAAAIAWLKDLRKRETERNAGDPGIVLARRLSNAEYDYTIRDLTGVDIRPTKEFPVDPANEAGFDNSGESLTMSPALLKKYLTAARLVADHVVLRPEGFVFAPHPAVTDTDRDKYCVHRIVDFYERHTVNYADYFLAVWRFRHREALDKPKATLADLVKEAGLSTKYLATIWAALNETPPAAGPLGEVQAQWRKLPPPSPPSPLPPPIKSSQGTTPKRGGGEGSNAASVRLECEKLRDLVIRLRKELTPKPDRLQVKGISQGSQPLVLWRNRQIADRHMRYVGDDKAADAAAKAKFCRLFPDAFFVKERAPYYDGGSSEKGRLLSAGFHLMQGYFRDDGPLYELVLDEKERRELDALWDELHFVTNDIARQYKDFIFFERAEPPRFMREAEFDFARSEDKDAVSEAKMKRLAEAYVEKARKQGASDEALAAIKSYFTDISALIRRVEKARVTAEPNHLDALLKFADRAYRRPLSQAERDDLLAFYRTLRKKENLDHEEALRDTIASILISPHFCYRLDLSPVGPASRAGPGTPTVRLGSPDPQPLTDYELASRLSYFLWSSMPDAELLSRAAASDLHKPAVLIAQSRRMLSDPRVRGLATEFAGNWLDIRRFEEHNSVDRARFPTFTNELRQAMFEEPIRYFMDIAQRNRSVLDLLYGKDTFVNPILAKHYGLPFPQLDIQGSGRAGGVSLPVTMQHRGANAPRSPDDWLHLEDGDRYGRGGLLPMAVFLTKNAPGLRTSPVKRGYWVVRRLLGEQIPLPPPTVPELPKDEAHLGDLTLPQLLARHRDHASCAGCHRRFDSVGLAFEGFGPIGERRSKDLGGKPVFTNAKYPDDLERGGLDGLRDYLRTKRQGDFIDNLCRKVLSYALGRGVLLSDTKTIDEMKKRLAAGGYRLGNIVEVIVTSRQFLNRRVE